MKQLDRRSTKIGYAIFFTMVFFAIAMMWFVALLAAILPAIPPAATVAPVAADPAAAWNAHVAATVAAEERERQSDLNSAVVNFMRYKQHRQEMLEKCFREGHSPAFCAQQ